MYTRVCTKIQYDSYFFQWIFLRLVLFLKVIFYENIEGNITFNNIQPLFLDIKKKKKKTKKSVQLTFKPYVTTCPKLTFTDNTPVLWKHYIGDICLNSLPLLLNTIKL